MPRGNTKNLRVPTSEQAREMGRKGGLASAANKKRKKQIREFLLELLEADIDGDTTGAEAMAMTVFRGALAGDWKAWELTRDTVGQKPAERVISTSIDADEMLAIESDIDEALNAHKRKGNKTSH